MKPHEETWTADPPTASGDCVLRASRDGGFVHEPIGEIEGKARARLAIQAPAMARLLELTMDDICDEESEHWQAIRRVLRDGGVIP